MRAGRLRSSELIPCSPWSGAYIARLVRLTPPARWERNTSFSLLRGLLLSRPRWPTPKGVARWRRSGTASPLPEPLARGRSPTSATPSTEPYRDRHPTPIAAEQSPAWPQRALRAPWGRAGALVALGYWWGRVRRLWGRVGAETRDGPASEGGAVGGGGGEARWRAGRRGSRRRTRTRTTDR